MVWGGKSSTKNPNESNQNTLNENNNKNTQLNESNVKNNTDISNESDLNLLPCDHYEYEFKTCTSLKGVFYNYYRGETQDCQQFQDLFVDCLKYKRDPEKNFDSLLKLNKYENELIKKRADSIIKNDVWQLRKEPPSDWNSQLPDWALERLKDTYWYKTRNQQTQQAQDNKNK